MDLLVTNSHAAVVAFDTDLRYTLWNPAMAEQSGVPAEKALGHTASELFGNADPVAVARVEATKREVVQGKSFVLRDVAYRSWDGREGYMDATYVPLTDGAGRIAGGVGLLNDTTDRKRLEDIARQKLKMEAVGQLTGGVAHDFNNILTIVSSGLDLLVQRIEARRGFLEDKERHLIEQLEAAVDRGRSLTEQLLAFSRKQRLDPRAVDLREVMKGMSEVLRRTLGERVDLRVDLPPDLPNVMADRNQLETALLNLMINARDAMPSGGAVRVTAHQTQLATGGFPLDLAQGRYVTVAIIDTGLGMDKAVLERASEPFFTTKPVGKGTGLGLSQVYGFARQSGGTITIQSAPGCGTTVTLYLPVACETVQKGSRASAYASTPFSTGRQIALLVEDEAVLRELAAEALRGLGYQVLEAGDGDIALRMLEQSARVDLLISDIVIPGQVNGVELAWKAREIRPGTAILLMSGYAERGGVHQNTEFPPGADFLPKPFRLQDLAEHIRAVFGNEHSGVASPTR